MIYDIGWLEEWDYKYGCRARTTDLFQCCSYSWCRMNLQLHSSLTQPLLICSCKARLFKSVACLCVGFYFFLPSDINSTTKGAVVAKFDGHLCTLHIVILSCLYFDPSALRRTTDISGRKFTCIYAGRSFILGGFDRKKILLLRINTDGRVTWDLNALFRLFYCFLITCRIR